MRCNAALNAQAMREEEREMREAAGTSVPAGPTQPADDVPTHVNPAQFEDVEEDDDKMVSVPPPPEATPVWMHTSVNGAYLVRSFDEATRGHLLAADPAAVVSGPDVVFPSASRAMVSQYVRELAARGLVREEQPAGWHRPMSVMLRMRPVTDALVPEVPSVPAQIPNGMEFGPGATADSHEHLAEVCSEHAHVFLEGMGMADDRSVMVVDTDAATRLQEFQESLDALGVTLEAHYLQSPYHVADVLSRAEPSPPLRWRFPPDNG